MQRQADHAPPERGERAVLVTAPSSASSATACRHARAGGGSINARSLDRRAPRRQLERQAGQVDLR